MKKINSLLTGLLLTASVFLTQQAAAQAPQKMSYQSVIRNSSNVLVASTPVGMQISVLQGNENGTAVFVETQTATTNANGLVSIEIGTGANQTGTFAGINWATGPYFIKTEIDPTGGSNYTITGTQEMLSVPYAMYAAKSGDATTMGAIGGSSSTNGGTITAGVLSLTPADATKGGIVSTGAQTIAGNKILTGTLGVGTGTPAVSAQLDVRSTTKGFLPPRMTSAQKNAIPTTGSDEGLTIWCTNCGSEGGQMQVFNGSAWTNMMGGPAAPGIGDSYQGGKVAYLLRPYDTGYDAIVPHGIIAAPSDQSVGIQWNNVGYVVVPLAYSSSIGTGNANTINIVTNQGQGSYAAKLCSDLSLNGYTDWYLPSIDELRELYWNKSSVGGFTNNNYWSSTNSNLSNAWYLNLGNSAANTIDKANTYYVRAVRSF